ncbi:MAG: hypothetical protein NTV23_15830 [Propionibacteriales bacterium]|nr:hypothetical protein [Propionibacteriales bacterium]
MRRRFLPWLLVGVLVGVLAGCGEDAKPVAAESVPHSHTGLPAGDGTRASYVGYTLADATFPTKAGEPGDYSFRIKDFTGATVTDYVTDLTRDMHVYVVSTDLAVYRHVHPTMAADGTWTGSLTVPRDGTYRLITEFIARRDADTSEQLVLGVERTVGKPGVAVPVPAASRTTTDDGVTLDVVVDPTVGKDRQMELGLSRDGEPASLGTYLGVYAHISAFNVETGALVHMHPLGTPETVDQRSVLSFHSGFTVAGEYRMFVQTRISGMVRTVPITVNVTG